MKLLYILPEYLPWSGGGIITFYRHLLPTLAAQGHQIDVLVGNAFIDTWEDFHADGVSVQFLDRERITKNLHSFDRYHATPELQRHLSVAWAAWEQAEGGKGYDAVETCDWGLLFVPWVVSGEGPPTVVQMHGSIGQIDLNDPNSDTRLQGSIVRLIETSTLSVADALQANSTANAYLWQQLTGRDVDYVPPALAPSSLSTLPRRSKAALVVGRIQYWKGPTVLCEALRLLKDTAVDIEWIGRDTAYRDSGTSMMRYLERNYADIWGKRIRPIGCFSSEETIQRQSSARFVIVPSTWDVFNYTCVEAMGQGQVVICSSGAGACDLIDCGVNGFIFEAGNPQSLAQSINKVLGMNEIEGAAMGEAARRTVQEKLSLMAIAQRRIASLQELVRRGKYFIRPSPWIIEAVSPQTTTENALAFLEKLPLAELSKYVLQRTLKKFGLRS